MGILIFVGIILGVFVGSFVLYSVAYSARDARDRKLAKAEAEKLAAYTAGFVQGFVSNPERSLTFAEQLVQVQQHALGASVSEQPAVPAKPVSKGGKGGKGGTPAATKPAAKPAAAPEMADEPPPFEWGSALEQEPIWDEAPLFTAPPDMVGDEIEILVETLVPQDVEEDLKVHKPRRLGPVPVEPEFRSRARR